MRLHIYVWLEAMKEAGLDNGGIEMSRIRGDIDGWRPKYILNENKKDI